MKTIPVSLDHQVAQAPRRPAGRRDGVSAEDVKKAVEKLIQEGVPVSLRTVRAELGTGSLSTVQKHLSALRNAHAPVQTDGPSPLSPMVLRALAADVEKVVMERTAKVEADLKDARTSVELLVEENESLRFSANETDGVLERTRASLAEYVGTVDALRAQLLDLGGLRTTCYSQVGGRGSQTKSGDFTGAAARGGAACNSDGI